MLVRKRKGYLKRNTTVVKTFVSLLKSFNFLITRCGRSKRPFVRFFPTSCSHIGRAIKKVSFFLSKSIEILSSTTTLTNFYLASSWQSLLTSIWFSCLTISHWFFIREILLNSGSEMPKSRIKKQQAFLKSAFFRKKK